MIKRRVWLLAMATLLAAVTLFEPRLPLLGPDFRFVFVLDITQSMNVDDVLLDGRRIRRLELAKQAVWSTIQRLACGSQVGLAVFTEHRSYLIIAPVEVCANATELQQILDKIDWHMAWRSRSEVAKGLISAMKIGAALEPHARIVFFSDGHEAPPVHPDLRQVPDRVAAKHIGAVVGVGGDGLSQIPKYSTEGKLLGYWQADEIDQVDVFSTGRDGTGEALVSSNGTPLTTLKTSGQEHLSSLRETWLKQLADDAGFRYVRMQTPVQTARFLSSETFAGSKTEVADARWLLGIASLLLTVLALQPAFMRRLSVRGQGTRD